MLDQKVAGEQAHPELKATKSSPELRERYTAGFNNKEDFENPVKRSNDIN